MHRGWSRDVVVRASQNRGHLRRKINGESNRTECKEEGENKKMDIGDTQARNPRHSVPIAVHSFLGTWGYCIHATHIFFLFLVCIQEESIGLFPPLLLQLADTDYLDKVYYFPITFFWINKGKMRIFVKQNFKSFSKCWP